MIMSEHFVLNQKSCDSFLKININGKQWYSNNLQNYKTVILLFLITVLQELIGKNDC